MVLILPCALPSIPLKQIKIESNLIRQQQIFIKFARYIILHLTIINLHLIITFVNISLQENNPETTRFVINNGNSFGYSCVFSDMLSNRCEWAILFLEFVINCFRHSHLVNHVETQSGVQEKLIIVKIKRSCSFILILCLIEI